MGPSLKLLIAINIISMVLGSPLGFSNQNESHNFKVRDHLDKEQENTQIDNSHMRNSFAVKTSGVETDSSDSDEDSEEDEYYDDTDYFDGSEEGDSTSTELVPSNPDGAANLAHNFRKEWAHPNLAPKHGHQRYYTSNGHQEINPYPGHLSYDPNHAYENAYSHRGYEHLFNAGYQDPYPNHGYGSYHHKHGYHGYQPSREYGGYHHGGYLGQHDHGFKSQHDSNVYQGHHNDHVSQGHHNDHVSQGHHKDRVNQGYSNQDSKGHHPNLVHKGNNLKHNNIDSKCKHADANDGHDSKPDVFVKEADSNPAIDDNVFEEEISEYPDLYYDDSEYEDEPDDKGDSEVSEDTSNDNKDHTRESKEDKNDSKPGDSLNSKKISEEISSPKSSESSESNETKLKLSIPSDLNKNDLKCRKTEIKDIKNDKTVTDTIGSDCISESSEGNKTGRLLDIFTRTNSSTECTTPKNESGQCKSFSECPIRNIVDNYNLFLQYMCLRGVFVGICCPDNPVLEISDSDENTTTEIIETQQPTEGCGLTQKTRIVGGTISAPHEWTWMVALLRRNRFFCGGVIINDWYVLTAAHCVLGINVKDLKVRLGEYNFLERTDHQSDINVAEIKRHALFVTATFQHDIALLKLKQRVEYSKFIGSICLPQPTGRSYSDEKATVVGWGTVSFGGAASPILRQVTVPVWENEDCDRTYSLEKIDQSFLCAGSTENGEDACQGDSGGPLMTLNPDNRWEVIGIVSWGRRCGDPTYPGVYTRVTSYLDWIAAHAK